MRETDIHPVIRILKGDVRQWQEPIVGVVAKESRDAFRILIACLLSLRTKDRTTADASRRLFALASDPSSMLRLSLRRIERAIYPVGFYRTKAKQIRAICRRLLTEYNGRVPDSLEDLLTLKGVGRKTANLVVTVGYGKPGISWPLPSVQRSVRSLGLSSMILRARGMSRGSFSTLASHPSMATIDWST